MRKVNRYNQYAFKSTPKIQNVTQMALEILYALATSVVID